MMVHFIHFKDPNSKEMIRKLKGLPQCPGTCFFMDINRSTDLKYEGGLTEWGRKLNNTFNYLLYANHFEKNIVKGIGDEMMLFIPDDVLKNKGSNNNYFALLEDIYSALFLLKHHPTPDIFLDCKVSIHYCTEVYNITFFEGANDYYGKDIDLTARLMFKSTDNRIVMSERFYNMVMHDLVTRKMPADSGCLKRVSGKFVEYFRGVPDPVEFRMIDVEHG